MSPERQTVTICPSSPLKSSYLASAGHAVRMSASHGLATFPEDAFDLTSLLALADKAMFRIKEGGKDAIGSTGG